MKKLLTGTLLITIFALLCTAGCSNGNSPEQNVNHEHNYVEGTVTPPTCSVRGYTEYSCECGESYKDNYTETVDHEGSFVCQYCQKTFVSMWKEFCKSNGTDGKIPVTGSDYYAMLSTNTEFDIVLTFGQTVVTSTASITLLYSEIDEEWIYVYQLGDYSIGGKFDKVASYASTLPYDYCQFKNISSARAAAFEAFNNLVKLTNTQLKTNNAKFSLQNLGILLKSGT